MKLKFIKNYGQNIARTNLPSFENSFGLFGTEHYKTHYKINGLIVIEYSGNGWEIAQCTVLRLSLPSSVLTQKIASSGERTLKIANNQMMLCLQGGSKNQNDRGY